VPKLKHFDSTGTARFITFICYRREPSLVDEKAKGILAHYIDQTRQKYKFRILGYVFMPDHVHLVIHPIDGTPIGKVIREIKSLSAREWFKDKLFESPEAKRVFWQKRCYDHNCRTTVDTREKITYCHNNPVLRNLVDEPAKWEWSSCNWYLGSRDVPLKIDSEVI
jgi:putative transposase